MTTSADVGDNLLNDKNTNTPKNKDPNPKELMKKFKAMKKKKKKTKKYNNYLSNLEPGKKITARDVLIKTGQIKEEVINEVSTAVVERDASRYLWALQELGYAATLPNVTMVVGTAMEKGMDVELMLGLVSGESSWRDDVVHSNGGSNDYGLFQLNNLWHNQHRGSKVNHIKAGIDHFKWCLKTEKGNTNRALSRYNTGGGDSPQGRTYASYINGKKREVSNKVRQYPRYVARQASKGNRIR